MNNFLPVPGGKFLGAFRKSCDFRLKLMKNAISTLLVTAGCALALASCAVTDTQSMQPRADVEAVERESQVTPTPNVGQHEAGRNAVRYANDRGYHGYGHGYGRYGNYPRPY